MCLPSFSSWFRLPTLILSIWFVLVVRSQNYASELSVTTPPATADLLIRLSASAPAFSVVLPFGDDWSSRNASAMRRQPAQLLVLRPRRSERSEIGLSMGQRSSRGVRLHDDIALCCALLVAQDRLTLFHRTLNSKPHHEMHAKSRKWGIGVLVVQVNEKK